MSQCLLADRRILTVAGDEAEALLNRLFTKNLAGMETSGACYAALLSPQGKLLFDFLVYRYRGEFWIDVPLLQAGDLAKKLAMFKLRAKVTISQKNDLAVAAAWGGVGMESPGPGFRDPRHNDLGYRIIAEAERLRSPTFEKDPATYAAHRIGLGVPEGGVDFAYGDTFVHDANLDLLHGVDFDKGCYIGQEVVSRVHHRRSARKRIVRLDFLGDPPAAGAPLTAGALQIGQLTSTAGRVGLATARIDRLEEAAASKAPVLAGETLVTVTLPTKSTVMRPTYDDDDDDL